MTINEDLKKYPVYALFSTIHGITYLEEIDITSTIHYDHYKRHIHHYIKQQEYKRNKKWFDERNIEQKLFLLPIEIHEQVHQQAIKNLSDEKFLEKYGISRWELLFNRKYSRY